MPFIVKFKRKIHNESLKKYEEIEHVVTYSKEEYHMYFAKDKDGKLMTKKVKQDDGKMVSEELSQPIKSVFEFESDEVIFNPYKDPDSKYEKIKGIKFVKDEPNKNNKGSVKKSNSKSNSSDSDNGDDDLLIAGAAVVVADSIINDD